MLVGTMIAMSPTVTIKGALKFSVKKLISGGEVAHSHYTGPGEVLFAPPYLGDVTMLRLTGKERQPWFSGKDAFVVATQGITREYKSQGLGKAMFSGEGLFVMKLAGTGLVWLSSFGAIIRKDVRCPLSCFFVQDCADAQLPCSSKRARGTSLTTGIWSRGTAPTSLSGSPVAALSRALCQEKALCASSRDLARFSCKQDSLRPLQPIWAGSTRLRKVLYECIHLADSSAPAYRPCKRGRRNTLHLG